VMSVSRRHKQASLHPAEAQNEKKATFARRRNEK